MQFTDAGIANYAAEEGALEMKAARAKPAPTTRMPIGYSRH